MSALVFGDFQMPNSSKIMENPVVKASCHTDLQIVQGAMCYPCICQCHFQFFVFLSRLFEHFLMFLLRPLGSQDYKLENFGWPVSRPAVLRVTLDLPDCKEFKKSKIYKKKKQKIKINNKKHQQINKKKNINKIQKQKHQKHQKRKIFFQKNINNTSTI